MKMKLVLLLKLLVIASISHNGNRKGYCFVYGSLYHCCKTIFPLNYQPMKNTYRALSKVGFLSKRYTFKFLFVAFLGIHVPLVAVVIFISTGLVSLSPLSVVLLTLIATLVATAITLLVLNGLLWPLHLGKTALDAYLENDVQPLLPTHHKDEAGVLLASIQSTIEKLDSLMEEKKDLISLFSHDMRTPTSQLVTLTRFIDKETDTDKIKEYTAIMGHVAQKQLAMLNDVLIMLKTDHEEGNRERFFSKLPLKELLEESMDELRLTAEEKNISFEPSIDHAACSVWGDKVMLAEALHNVLINAIKFSHPNNKILVEAQSVPSKCIVTITDYGVGFDDALNKKLFEKFTKLGKSGTAGEHSTGLGLYLTRKILRQHNGSITAHSAGEEMGATFILEIPCK
jgi:signal transduction histidine kinase